MISKKYQSWWASWLDVISGRVQESILEADQATQYNV